MDSSLCKRLMNINLLRSVSTLGRLEVGSYCSGSESLETWQFMRSGISYMSGVVWVVVRVQKSRFLLFPHSCSESLCVTITSMGSLVVHRMFQGDQMQHKASGTVWTTSILSLL